MYLVLQEVVTYGNESQDHRGPMVESIFFEPPRETRIDSLTEESGRLLVQVISGG